MNTWLTDLKEGEQVEQNLIAYYALNGVRAQRNVSSDVSELRKWDVRACGGGLIWTDEVKWDRYVEQSKNVALEHRTLVLSEADYVVYRLGQAPGWYHIPRLRLLRLIASKQYPRVRGGDQDYMLTLMPLREFYKHFKQI